MTAVFVDTSALFAALNALDEHHPAARTCWEQLLVGAEELVTSNYVLVETIALVGRRLGVQAVRDLQANLVPILRVLWVDEALHSQALAALLTAADRDLSLVDCVSFELMRRQALDTAFAFDAHFGQQGFRTIP